MSATIEDPWLSFLRDVDRALSRPVVAHCLGGFVLAVLWELPRPTGDVDFIEVEPPEAASELLDIAGEESELASRYKLHFHRVAVAEYPEGYLSRLVSITPNGFKRLRLMALEVHDLVLAKLGRNSPRDRSDVEFLAQKRVLDAGVLKERFEEVSQATINPQDKPRTLKNKRRKNDGNSREGHDPAEYETQHGTIELERGVLHQLPARVRQ